MEHYKYQPLETISRYLKLLSVYIKGTAFTGYQVDKQYFQDFITITLIICHQGNKQ